MEIVRTLSSSVTWMTWVGQMLAQVPQPMQRPSTGSIRRCPFALAQFERPGTDHLRADPLAQEAADAPVGRRVDADAEFLGHGE